MRRVHIGRTIAIPLVLAATVCAPPLGTSRADSDEKQAPSYKGSIVVGTTSESNLPDLANIRLHEAIKIAHARVPGDILSAETEEENGYLVHTVEIVTADKSIIELTIDAGNGTVLSQSLDQPDGDKGEEDEEGDDED